MDQDRLIEMIVSASDDAGDWNLETDRTLDALGVKPVDYYRRIYAERDRVDALVHKTIDYDSVLTFARGAFEDHRSIERRLFETGVVFSHDARIELTELFVDAVVAEAQSHEIDLETFDSMRRYTNDDLRAVELYLEHAVDLKSRINEIAERFVGRHIEMVANIGVATATRTLRELFQRHVLSVESLVGGLRDRLLSYCGIGSHFSVESANGLLHDALSDFGIDRLPDGAAELKRLYRSLMKTYHPDVNPVGLKMSQRITKAYSVLKTAIEEGSGG